MRPFRKVVDLARHERTIKTVKAGSNVFGTVRNLAAIGAAVATVATGGFFVARDQASAAVTPAPAIVIATPTPAPSLDQFRGRLAFETNFQLDIGTPPPVASGRTAAPTRRTAQGIEVTGAPNAGSVGLPFRRQAPSRFLAETTLVFRGASDGQLIWSLRSANSVIAQLIVDSANELMRFQMVDTSVTPARTTPLIASAVPLAGLRRGDAQVLGVVVDGARYRVFVANELLIDVTDARIPVLPSETANLSLSINPGTRGVVAMSGLRVYALP